MNQLQERTLRLANRIRGILDKEPLTDLPKGQRSRVRHCMVARALDADFQVIGPWAITGTRAYARALEKAGFEVERTGTVAKEQWRVMLPGYCAEAVERFDNGAWPEYIEEREIP